MKDTMNKSNNKGFTLVELIVVLVILAILAAILLPALLGYIDEAKDKESLLRAKSCLTAIQSELSKCYAKYSSKLSRTPTTNYDITGENPNVIIIQNHTDTLRAPNGENEKQNKDVHLGGTKFAENVMTNLDNISPYCILFGTGRYVDTMCSLHDCYSVAFLYYQETADSKPWFYYNGEWTHVSYRANGNQNFIKKDGTVQKGFLKGKKIRYYFLSKNTSDSYDTLWNNLIGSKYAS